ncbi:MAG TPA: hypothetical protein VFH15_06250 [Pyrinomonadaceae bacterium]|nr:hypothetical protein [Pyrinomonadaceae bacterium]
MKKTSNHNLRQIAFIVLLTAMAAGSSIGTGFADQKMKAEELVAKHLESIAPAETLASVKTRIVTGTVVVTFREPATGQLGGRMVMASAGNKNMLGMIFDNSTNYPAEKIGFDGDEVSGSYVRPGARSTLADFMLTHRTIVKQGLVGGALSQSWPLLDLTSKKPKLEMSGTRKIGERQAYQLKYFPSGGSDLQVSLFFDVETFQHLRTEYNRTIVAAIGSTPDTSARQRESRYKMVEDFSDFRKEGPLMLPHKYRIQLELAGQGTFKAEWDMTLEQVRFNNRLDPKSFDVDDK